jgi:hypothetical protein
VSEPIVKLVGMATLALVEGGWPDSPLWEGWSRFVPRFSWKDGFLLGELPTDRSTTIAKSLAQAGGDAQLVLHAHREPLRRVVLEPEAWHNQRPSQTRPTGFHRLGERASLADELNPAVLRSSSATALVEYALAFLNAEEARHADAVLPPYHLAGGHGSATREGELHLAETVATLIRRERIALRGEAPKPLLVGIAVDATAIRDEQAAVALARSYAAMDCDGYWVQFANVTEASPPDTVRVCCVFLYALQELSRLRVFAVDVKNLVWPLLAGGLFGACLGIGEREAWQGPAGVSNVRRQLKPTVVHPELLRNFVASGADARRAFRDYPCECDAHDPESVPQSRPEIRRHALRVRLVMAEAATSAGATAVVTSWLTEASWAAGELGLDPPRSQAYGAALAAANEWRSADTG